MVELREYELSLAAKAKENTIRGIARALKLAGVKVDPDAELDVIAKTLSEQLPHPRKGKSFSEEAKAQERVCKTIAGVLNDEFTPGASKPEDKLIDTSLGAASVCQQVSDWVYSFTSGVHREFLDVYAGVKRAERNIEALEEIMRQLYSKITERASKDPEVSRDITVWNEVYRRAQNERRVQAEKLKAFLNITLAPAQKELEIAMRDESEAHKMIEKIGLKPGTSEFAHSLTMAVSGLGTVAVVAARVHKALKQVGISVNEYLNSSDVKQLQEMLDRKMMSGETEDVAKFLEAVRTLRTNFERRSELASALKGETATGGSAAASPPAASGGDDEEKESTIDRRIRKKEAEHKIIVKDFTEKVSRHYDEIISSIKAIAPKLGKEIPLSDRLEDLRNALLRMEGMRERRNELALIGVYADATAREQRDTFLATIRLVLGSVNSVMELEMYRSSSAVFARLRAALEGLAKTVDFYFDVVQKKYGGEEASLDFEAVGGAAELPPEMARSALTFKEAIDEFAYDYYIAKIRSNLDQTGEEIEEYGAKYADVLGDAVATRLRVLAQDKKSRLELLTDKDKAGSETKQNAAIDATAGLSAQEKAARKEAVAAVQKKRKEFIENEFSVKEKFYRALQALDLYMKAFTQGLTSDPDAVRDIKKILDGVQTIMRWFSEQAGESLAQAFDLMPQVNVGGGALIPITSANQGVTISETAGVKRAPPGAAGDHYYERLRHAMGQMRAAAADGAGPGVPQASIVLEGQSTTKADTEARVGRVEGVRRKIGEFFDNFQGLKNLVNAFARIGERFGGKDLRTQVFMSPTQIYKALLDYLRESALSMGIDEGRGPINWPLDGLRVAAGAGFPVAGATAEFRPYEVYFSSVGSAGNDGLGGRYQLEDQYFCFMIKAMAAKVLTVTGVYDLFQRPGPVRNLTPVRMIIGGADEAVEVVEGASELYFRLPRLAEFYKKLFYWDGTTGSLRISMIPEMEDVFSGLIRLIFQRSGADQGDYSDVEIRMLIREINNVYSRFHDQSPEKVTQNAISSFVKEVNRRYGVVKREDMKKYWDMVRENRASRAFEAIGQTNYSILPGEDDDETERRLAPSDRFVLGEVKSVELGGRFSLDTDINDFNRPPADPSQVSTSSRFALLWSLRRALDTMFQKELPATGLPSVSYAQLIRQAQMEIKKASSQDGKFEVVSKLIQGTSIASVDVGKAFMFHETVVIGLNVLSGIYTMLAEFDQRLNEMDVKKIEDAVKAGLATGTVTPGGAALTPVNFTDAVVTAWIAAAIPKITAAAAGRYVVPSTLNYVVSALGRNWMPARDPDGNALRGGDLYQMGRRGGSGAAGDVRAQKLFAHLVINYQDVMTDLLSNLFGVTASFQGLVDLRFPNSESTQIHLDFSKLRSTVEELLANVKHYLDLFRPHLPRDIISRFEDRSNAGSVFWLEENLIDGLIRGVPGAAPGTKNTLEDISRKANGVFMHLTRELDFSAVLVTRAAVGVANPGAPEAFTRTIYDNNAAAIAAISAGGAIPAGSGLRAGIPADELKREYFGSALSRVLFYDNLREAANGGTDALAGLGNGTAIGATGATDSKINALVRTNSTREAADAALFTLAAISRYQLYGNAPGMTAHRSLMMAFNQLVAKFLMTFYDGPSGRIYLNLVNALANGTMSQAVVRPVGGAFPDIVAAARGIGFCGDPKPGAVLLQSLAFALQRIVKDVNPNTQAADHIVSTLVDVPIYLKESFRANLPYYIKFFELIVKQGEFIKSLLQRTRIKVGRPSETLRTGAALGTIIRSGGADRNVGAAGAEYVQGGTSLGALEAINGDYLDSATMRARLTAIVDSIVAGATTLSSSSADVLRELNDQGTYLETGEGFIAMYKSRYNRLPLMPASLLTTYIRNLDPADRDVSLFPEQTQGTELFKLAYGSRLVLNKRTAITLDNMPGVKAILDTYNGVTQKRDQMPTDKYQSFIQKFLDGLRFIIDTRNFAGYLTVSEDAAFMRSQLIGTATSGIVIAGDKANAAYPIVERRQATVEVVEGIAQEDQISAISLKVGTVPGAARRDRSTEWILNLIDLNIVPINVHAMMRDVPLANLYNYSYTFEQMVAASLGQSVTDIEGRSMDQMDPTAGDAIRDTKQLMVKMLINPYVDIPAKVFGSDLWDIGSTGLVHRLFRGDTSTGLGRPKFLSDQVFGKALFGTPYQHSSEYDEAGPGVGSGVSRGRELPTVDAIDEIENFRDGQLGRAGGVANTLWAALQAAAGDATGVLLRGAYARQLGGPNAAWTPSAALSQAAGRLRNVGQILRRRAATDDLTAVWNEADALAGIATEIARRIGIINGISAAVDAGAAGAPASAAQWAAANAGGAGAANANADAVLAAPSVTAAVAAGGATGAAVANNVALAGLRLYGAAGTAGSIVNFLTRLTAMIDGGGVNNNAARSLTAVSVEALRGPAPQRARLDVRRDAWAPRNSLDPRATTLTYLHRAAGEETKVHNVQVDGVDLAGQANNKSILELVGRRRFDTRLIRNVFFIVNVLRLTRLKLARELTQVHSVIATSHSAVASSVTEYDVGSFGPNEVLPDQTYGGI